MEIAQQAEPSFEIAVKAKAQRQLEDLRRLHAYTLHCYAEKRISEAQLTAIESTLNGGWTSLAGDELVTALSANFYQTISA